MTEIYRITGLMSGSSMDGVDLACCEFEWNNRQWEYKILAAETFPYPAEFLAKLEQACFWKHEEIVGLDLELGRFYAELLHKFHKKNSLLPAYISSHGHTILHDPREGITLQAGNGRMIANLTGITVINDFRSEDVAQGGQGAPLVPLGDRLLFSDYDACLNLGGFANISLENDKGKRIAYDLCPANMALNHLASREGLAFDRDGEMAGKGHVHMALLEKLNSLEYYSLPGPKSLGREWFLEYFLPVLQHSSLNTNDLMASVQEHIVWQIARGIHGKGIRKVLVTGGGTLNQSLLNRLKHHTDVTLVIPDEQLIHYKEALIFALLGILRIRGEINCLASVTGGRRDLSAGTIHKPKK